MAEFPSVTVDLSEQLEFPGDSYPLTGKVDVATYTVGEKEYQLQDGIAYDVVFTNAGTGVSALGHGPRARHRRVRPLPRARLV